MIDFDHFPPWRQQNAGLDSGALSHCGGRVFSLGCDCSMILAQLGTVCFHDCGCKSEVVYHCTNSRFPENSLRGMYNMHGSIKNLMSDDGNNNENHRLRPCLCLSSDSGNVDCVANNKWRSNDFPDGGCKLISSLIDYTWFPD